MEPLIRVASDAESAAAIVEGRVHPEGLTPLLCYSDQACLYADPASSTGYRTCDPSGTCATVEACADGEVFSGDACVVIGDPCGRVVDHEVYKYYPDGACGPSGSCETDWVWNGSRCDYASLGAECDNNGNGDSDRVSRYDRDGECTPRDECRTLAFSSAADSCVEPNTVCAPPSENRLLKYNAAGECVPSNECIPQWELVDGSCAWGKRHLPCDPTPEEIARDDKRVFEFDVQGACMPSDMCASGWSLGDDGVCSFDQAGGFVERRSGRNYVYDKRRAVVPAGCVDGYSLVGDACLFDDRNEECAPDNNQVSVWNSRGECVPTGRCVSDEFVFRDGACVPRPRGCPPGFSASGSECYRRFDMGGEGTRAISFTADPTQAVRARYTFRKHPRYNDGDYTISSNFGFGGGQGGIRGSHSRSSGWATGKSTYTFHARQNDGNGVLEVWVKNP